MRRAKIVCTLGPASSDEKVLIQMVEAGMDVARLNFSHGDHESHRQMVDVIRSVSKRAGRPLAILQDLQGPKIRVGKFADGSVVLKDGTRFTITTEDIEGTAQRVGTTYPSIVDDVKPGDILLLDDGLLRLRAIAVEGTELITEVEVGGTLSNNKGINLPTAAVSAPSLTEKDVEDLIFGLTLDIDFIALSFVRSALDIHQLRAKMGNRGKDIQIISKIEKPQAVESLEAIISVSDGIMIARGDLGVELPPQNVPVIQKKAIAQANKMGRISITATQMLDSMQENPRPTRAEASDVANAVLDGTDAVMLSGETATGKYPVEAVQMMASIITEIEESSIYRSAPTPDFIPHLKTFPNAVAKAATVSADELDVLGIAVLTLSGATARMMMTYRPNKPIIACTPNPRACNQMAAYWGVSPFLVDIWSEEEKQSGLDEELTHATQDALSRIEDLLKYRYGAKPGDKVIVVMGFPITSHSETNLLKFHRIGDD